MSRDTAALLEACVQTRRLGLEARKRLFRTVEDTLRLRNNILWTYPPGHFQHAGSAIDANGSELPIGVTRRPR